MIARTVLLLGLLTGPARELHAQVTKLSDMSFPTVISGQTTNLLYTAAGAARWRLHFSIAGAGVSVSFGLPTTLARSSGGQTMAITWPAGQGAYRINSNTVSGATTFTPASGVNFGSTLFLLNNDIYFWMGARVSPPLNQVAGTYTGTVSMTVAGISL